MDQENVFRKAGHQNVQWYNGLNEKKSLLIYPTRLYSAKA